MYRQKYGSFLVPGPGYAVEILEITSQGVEAKRSWVKTNMSNGEEASEDEQRLVKEIDKEIN